MGVYINRYNTEYRGCELTIALAPSTEQPRRGGKPTSHHKTRDDAPTLVTTVDLGSNA